jgi:hypothetical protein
MGLLRQVAGETRGELMEDGFRGYPDVDLSDYAASRGLDFRGQKSQLGYLAAFPWAEELMFNVMRGDLPGGERGVLLHEVKLLDDDAPGTFYGVKEKTAGFKAWHLLPGAGLFSQSWNYFRAPHTTAAVRIPEATGSLHGLHVARRSERYRSGSDYWQPYKIDPSGWRPVSRKRADPAVVEEVLVGPVKAVLSQPREYGFTIGFMYGQLVLFQQNFLKQPEDLDTFGQLVSWLAREIRRICAPTLTPQPFETELPPPEWLDSVAALPDERHLLAPQGVWLERVLQIAQERRLVLEDSLSFHRAFPQLPVPGEAFGVMRGDGIRLLCCIERSIRDISQLKDLFPNPGGPVGANVAVLPAPGMPDTDDGGDGILTDGTRHAVRDGILCVWQRRDEWQANGESLDELAATARSLRL